VLQEVFAIRHSLGNYLTSPYAKFPRYWLGK